METEKSPGVHTRWGVVREIPALVAVEELTWGRWTEDDFRRHFRDRKCIVFVACCQQTAVVRGFVVYELSDTEYGARYMRVINMAATDPVARRAILDKLERKSVRNDRTITWNEEQ